MVLLNSSTPEILPEIGGIEFFDRLFEFFTGTEFDDRAFRDDDFVFGVAGVAALAALANFDFKNAEVAQFDFFAAHQFGGDIVKGQLNDISNFGLNDAGFIGNFDMERKGFEPLIPVRVYTISSRAP